ncbi:MAG: DNA gyrase modulator, partial [Mariprofundaceae bacterium]|nr:DNA gyrase modulator [Mariprofundaceae bacterium]
MKAHTCLTALFIYLLCFDFTSCLRVSVVKMTFWQLTILDTEQPDTTIAFMPTTPSNLTNPNSSLPIAIETLQSVLSNMLPAHADDGDLYIEHGVSESLALEEGRVKHVSASTHQGMGARVIKGESAGHAFTDRFDSAALMQAGKSARAIAESGQN